MADKLKKFSKFPLSKPCATTGLFSVDYLPSATVQAGESERNAALLPAFCIFNARNDTRLRKKLYLCAIIFKDIRLWQSI